MVGVTRGSAGRRRKGEACMSKHISIRLPAALALSFGLAGAAAAAEVTVAVTAIVEHPALDAVRQGVQDELAAQG